MRLASILSQAHVQGGALGVHIPQLLGLHGEIGLVIMEQLEAPDLSVALKECQAAEREDLVKRAARGLAGFHSLRIDVGGNRLLTGELAEVRRKLASIGDAAPLLTARAEHVLGPVEGALHQLPPLSPKVIHGGYKASQAFVAGDRVGVVDLEGTCLGDPAIDVGNFIAVLHRDAVLQDDDSLRGLATHFLAAYSEASGDDAVARRARFLQSIELVRIAARKFERSPHRYQREGEHWAPLGLLDEAAACFEALC